MSVVYELKQKRAALIDRLQQLERERVDIQELMRALERVILSYEQTSRHRHSRGQVR